MAAGLSEPSVGTLRVLGQSPSPGTDDLRERVGYLDQDRPLYKSFRVAEMLRFGEMNNPTWSMDVAKNHLAHLDIPLRSRVSDLSGGQQAQVALTLCLAKQPELLLLDEPASALDPVAREDLLRLLMRQVADSESSVVLSTHALSDVAAICDYVIVLAHARVVLSDDTEYIVETHRILSIVGDDDLGRSSCGWDFPSTTIVGSSIDQPWRRLSWPICEQVRPIVMVATSTRSKAVRADVGRVAPAALHRDCVRPARRCRIRVGADHGPARAIAVARVLIRTL
jgi:ABC-type sulfate/molybdate transport systems ATPase subunit